MGAGSARYGVAVLILVILWIAVYWWTPAPAPDPVISFGEAPQLSQAATTVAKPAVQKQGSFLDPIASPSPSQRHIEPRPAPTQPQPVPQAPATVTPPATPASPPAKPAAPATAGVLPPTFRDYTVRSGDTAEAISRRFFGTGEYWQQIMKANPRVDFMRLRAGRVIRIPVDPANVQGVRDTSAPAPTPAPTVEYRVKSGDTLSDIAREIYGRASLWTIIRDANRNAVGADGSQIRPGMVLKIPPAPSGAGG